MSTVMHFRGKRFLFGQPHKPLSNEIILPGAGTDSRDSGIFVSRDGFRCRMVDILLTVESGWVDPVALCRWVGTDIRLLVEASKAGILEAAVTRGSELALLRVRDQDKLRVMVADYKRKIRKELLAKAGK